MRVRTLCIGLALLLSVCGLAFGQSATGAITGVVRDPSGAVMPNVAIKITNEQTGQAIEVKTDALGNYTAPLLRPGI